MARLVISHSSCSNENAIEVRDCVAANSLDDVSPDPDVEHGRRPSAGGKLTTGRPSLRGRARASLGRVAGARPMQVARLMRKKFVAPTEPDKSQAPFDLLDEQFVDLSQTYRRIVEGLDHAGLDQLSLPSIQAAGRPGFAYFEEQDVAVSFRRGARIVRGLDQVRSSCAAAPPVWRSSCVRRVPARLLAGQWPRLTFGDKHGCCSMRKRNAVSRLSRNGGASDE